MNIFKTLASGSGSINEPNESDFQSTIKEEIKKKQENPRFIYGDDRKEYNRPKLAEKIIWDYIEKHKKEITFNELGKALFPNKMNKKNSPFVKAEEAKDRGSIRKDGSRISDYYGYYNNPMKIADAEICSCTWYSDEELIELINNAELDFKLDDIRI